MRQGGYEAASSESSSAWPTGKDWLLAVLLAPLLMYQADATIVNVANPSIRAGLDASGAELELIVGGYLLASAMLVITGARLGEMRGYRRVFLFGLGAFTLASLAAGLAPSATALIAARIAQGAAGALMLPQVLSGIQLNFGEGVERTRALGLYAFALAGGAVVGQVLGGVLVAADLFGTQWRAVFLINVPIGAAVLLAGLRFLPADRAVDRSRRVDLPGVATLSTTLLLVILPLTLGREAQWPAWTWICLAASLPMLALFVALERRLGARGGRPLITLEAISRPAIAWGLWPQAMVVSTYYALLFTLARYLQRGLGHSPLVSGLVLLPWVVAFGVPGRIIGRFPKRFAPLLPAGGCLILAVAYAAISADMFAGARLGPLLIVLLAIGGFGLGLAFTSILAHLTSAATPRYAPDISGVFTTSLQVAGAIGVAAFGSACLGLIDGPGASQASDALALTCAMFAITALIAFKATHATAQAGTG